MSSPSGLSLSVMVQMLIDSQLRVKRVELDFRFGGCGRVRIAMDQFAPRTAVVVKAFSRLIKDERYSLSVVAIEPGVVEEIAELRSVSEVFFQSTSSIVGEFCGEFFGGVAE